MRKAALIVCMGVVMGGYLYAVEGADGSQPTDGILLGSIVTMESFKSGGSIEFGFPIISNYDGLSLRNHVQVNGYGTHAAHASGVLGLSNKVMIGGLYGQYRSYMILAGGMGVLGNTEKKLLSMTAPYFWEMKFGGGTEVFTHENISFFLEFGGGVNGTTTDSVVAPFLSGSFAHLAVGVRSYF